MKPQSNSIFWVATLLLASLAFVAGGWFTRHQGPDLAQAHSTTDPPGTVQNETEILALKKQNTSLAKDLKQTTQALIAAERQLETQRSIIRQHSLKPGSKSIAEMLALFPSPFPAGNWAPAEHEFEDCWFESIDGLRIHGWYLKHPDPQAIVLYAHGNAGNVTHRATVAKRLYTTLGASVLVFDYRGYGRSEGVPTIEGLVHDARAAWDYLAVREGVQKEDVVLMGRSLGGAVAVQLASEFGARGLVLESTFSSLRSVATQHYPGMLVNLLVADQLNSSAAIAQFQGPVFISHGDRDQTIPFSLGQELFEAANEPKTFFRIEGGDHNDSPPANYYEQLKPFIKNTSQPTDEMYKKSHPGQ